MQQSIKSIKGGMIYLDMNQKDCDLYVERQKKERVDKDIISFYHEVHIWAEKKVQLQEELSKISLYLDNAKECLVVLAESYRKIHRDMPEKPQWEEVGQNGSFDTSMRTVLDGSEETRSETAPNPYVVAGLSSGY